MNAKSDPKKLVGRTLSVQALAFDEVRVVQTRRLFRGMEQATWQRVTTDCVQTVMFMKLFMKLLTAVPILKMLFNDVLRKGESVPLKHRACYFDS